MSIEKLVMDTDFKNVSNLSYVIGNLISIRDRGTYDGIDYLLVEVKPLGTTTSNTISFIILPDCEKSQDKINSKALVYAQGELVATFGFNDKVTKHIFIKPSVIKTLPDDFHIEKLSSFFVDYTKYNRVVLDCEVNTDPEEKSTPKGPHKFRTFKVAFKGDLGNDRTIQAIVWDTVDGIPSINKGDKLKLVGSLYIREFDRPEGVDIHYTLYVQKILRNDVDIAKVSDDLFQ